MIYIPKTIMDDQLQEPEQSCEPTGPGYFTNMDHSDQMQGSLAAVYSELLVVEKRSFFQIQPMRSQTSSGKTRF
jgi:hypothetical protein